MPDLDSEKNKPKLLPKVWTDKRILERAEDFLKAQLEKALPDHKAREMKWLEWDNVYRLIDRYKPSVNDGGCTVVDPEPQIQVDVMKANFLEAFFSSDPGFEYKGQENSDDEQAEIMTAYRADHLRRINLREKMERTIHQWLVYGTAICKDPWRKEVSKRRVRDRVLQYDKKTGSPLLDRNGNKRYKIVEKEIDFPSWDDTDWEYVSMYDFFPVGKGSDVQSLEGVIHRSKVSFDDLKKNERDVVEVNGQELVSGVYYNLNSIEVTSTSKFDLIEYWGKIPKWVLTGEEKDRYITWEGLIACPIDVDSTYENMLAAAHSEKTGELSETDKEQPVSAGAIRCQENPFWHGERPFRTCPYTPVDDEFYGVGMIEPQVEKWHELNTTIRQLVDNKTLMLLNPTIEDANANVQRDVKLIKFPRIKADDVNAVQPLRLNDFSQNGWRVIAALKDDMRRASGALETLQGIPMKDERVSATEFQGTFQQAGVRLKSRIRLFDEKMYKKFLDRSYQNDMQFAEFERIVRVVGKKGVRFQRVRPEDIWGTYDVITNGPLAFENNVIKVNKLTNFFAIASRAPQFANIPAILKKMWVKMDIGPEHEADEIIITNEPESSYDIQSEIASLSMGQRVMAKRNQDHQKHIDMKMRVAESLIRQGKMDNEIYRVFEDNVNQHLEYIEKLQAMQMAQGQLGSLAQNGPETPIPNAGEQPTVNPTAQMQNDGGGLV